MAPARERLKCTAKEKLPVPLKRRATIPESEAAQGVSHS
jgi:hypothetical protein